MEEKIIRGATRYKFQESRVSAKFRRKKKYGIREK